MMMLKVEITHDYDAEVAPRVVFLSVGPLGHPSAASSHQEGFIGPSDSTFTSLDFHGSGFP
jgi:hypothetical protein